MLYTLQSIQCQFCLCWYCCICVILCCCCNNKYLYVTLINDMHSAFKLNQIQATIVESTAVEKTGYCLNQSDNVSVASLSY